MTDTAFDKTLFGKFTQKFHSKCLEQKILVLSKQLASSKKDLNLKSTKLEAIESTHKKLESSVYKLGAEN